MCDRKVSSKEQFKKHILLIHSYQCENCEKKFTILFDLNNHNSLIHSVFETKPFDCNHCDVKFTLKKHVRRHIEDVHMRKRTFQCDDCGRLFGRKTYFKIHKSLDHPYPCNTCEKKFIKPLQLKKHYTIVHKKAKNDQELKDLVKPANPSQCITCDKFFKRKKNLRVHSLILHQYNCGRCDKKFTKRAHLEEHNKKTH